ncbi:peptide-methionine (S)-S-oxide reductase, partial [Arthrospira platensis SPKY1]|nr:peptide-methionine (S)-S-oxide reductase [Arthrospira platensis SPKY1]
MKWLVIYCIMFSMVFTACAEDKGNPDAHRFKTAVFAGGCFWCMEPAFEALDGVKDVVSGYTGGRIENPSYEDVSAGETGHIESVQ